jgi:hypothetical protein
MVEFRYNAADLELLFNKAKEHDEFEFGCTLLRIRGLESAGWDSLIESEKLVEEFLSFLNTPLDGMFKMRMLLLIYSHITEMDDFYSIVANLLWVIKGLRYKMDPFNKLLFVDRKEANSPYLKVERIKQLSHDTGIDKIGEIYDYLLVKQVRNAFYHSDFVLFKNEFRIVKGAGVNIDGTIQSMIPFQWIIRRIEVTTNFFRHLMFLVNEHRCSYTEDKIVTGRMGQNGEIVNMRLLGGDQGLHGIQSV